MTPIEEARAAGYSEEDIQAHLAPKVAEAQAQGYSEADIGKHLGIKPIDHAAAAAAMASRVQTEITKGQEGGNRNTALEQMGQTVKDAATVYAPIEAALNLATGFAQGFPAYLIGGVGGLIARHTYSPETDPKEIATKFAQAMTYQPHTDAGQRFTNTATYPLRTLMDWSESGGKKVADTTGSPAAAAITEATIQMLPAFLIPAFGRMVGGKTPANGDFYNAAKDIVDTHAAVAARDLQEPMVNVYHGSKAEFEKFDSSKIGTGEGAQSKGHGLYFSEAPEIGSFYSTAGAKEGESGNVYKAAIPQRVVDRMLDWDKPLTEQTPEIQKALASVMSDMGVQKGVARTDSVSALLDYLAKEHSKPEEGAPSGVTRPDPAAAADLLKAEGIEGVKYGIKGASGRFAAAEGKNNYVLFNAEHIQSLQRMQQADLDAIKSTFADKAQTVYEKTGIDPETLKEEAIKDPTVMADLASSNQEIPRAMGGKGPPKEPPAPPKEPPPPAEPPPEGSVEEAQAAVLSRVSVGEVKPREYTWAKAYTAAKDDLYPIAAIEKALTDGKSLDTAESPYQLQRLVRGAAGKATQFLDFGTFDFNTYKNTGPGLKEILDPHKTDLEGMRAYMVARRSVELYKRGIETGVPGPEAVRVVEAGGKYAKAFDQLQEYQNSLTKYLRDSGLLSEETYAGMLEANKDYVPFFRLFDQPKGGTGGTVRNPIREIKGSERIIVDPIESIIKNTYLYTALAERNAALSKFGDLIKTDPEAATDLGISRVKTKMRPVTLDEREIRNLFDAFVSVSRKTNTERTETSSTATEGGAGPGGVSEPTNKIFQTNKKRVEDALAARGFREGEVATMILRLQKGVGVEGGKDTSTTTTIDRLVKEVTTTESVPELNIRLPNDAATIFRPNAMQPTPNQVRFFEDGKPITLEVPRDVAEAFKSTDKDSANILLRIIAAPARTLRAGAILSPDFILRNPLRDQYSAFINSNTGYIPVWDMLKGAMSIAKKDGDFQDWLKSGGANSALVSLDREYLQQHLETLNKDAGLLQKSWNVLSSPIEVLRVTSELMENATRLGDFKRAGAQSKAEIQAAGFDSREVTLDFQRIGAATRGLNMIAAFMNAGLEGLDRTARAFMDDPVRTTVKTAAAITMPSVLLWYANNSTPERQQRWREIPAWQRDLFWIVMTDENTFRIPKPFEVGVVFGSLPERMLDQFAADKPDAMSGFLKSVGRVASVNLLPTGAVPFLEQTTNHSFFTDNPLIPSRMEGILPEYQYQEYTTQASRTLGRLIGAFPGMHANSTASPIVIDNYIRGWTGGLGTYARDLMDFTLRKEGVLPDPPQPLATLADIPVVKAFVVRHPSTSAQSIQDFYDKYGERKKEYTTFQYLVERGDVAAAKKEAELAPGAFVQMDGIHDSLGVLNDLVRKVYRDPGMTPTDKRQLIDTMYGQMAVLSRAGNTMMLKVDEKLAK